MLVRTPARSIACTLLPALALTATATVAAPSSAADPATPIAAKALVRLAGPKARLESWKRELCARPELACANDTADLELYRMAGDAANTVWGIVSSGPALVKLQHGGGSDWKVDRIWDFADYPHSHPSGGCGGSTSSVWMYPAVYPVGPSRWAVALIGDLSECYSGGGATYSIADIVLLGDDAGAPATALYRALPFACSKMIRACFTEEDYRTRGSRCHDEFGGYLTLRYSPSASPSRYAWTAIWHEKDTSSRQAVPLPPPGGDVWSAFSAVDLCEGGPVALDEDDGLAR